MILIPIIIWLFLFSFNRGIKDGLRHAYFSNIKNNYYVSKAKKIASYINTLLIAILPFIAIYIDITTIHFILVSIGSLLSFYFLHDGAYFLIRGIYEKNEWSFSTTSNPIYIERFSLDFPKRKTLFFISLGYYIILMVSI